MTVKISGIKACSTMQKAFAWLDAHGVAYDFRDYKKVGADRADLERWCDRAGWEKVINRSGLTFRKLAEEAKANLDREKAIALMLAQPSMIKRPILETGETLELGFSPERYAAIFGA